MSEYRKIFVIHRQKKNKKGSNVEGGGNCEQYDLESDGLPNGLFVDQPVSI